MIIQSESELAKYGNSTPMFSLNGYKTLARVVDVYDGDTLKIVFKFKDTFYKFDARLINIDACEIRNTNTELKNKAIEARDFVVSLLLKQKHDTYSNISQLFENNVVIVTVFCYDFDKYGRILVDIFTQDSENIKDLLIEHKLAHYYDGGKKLTEDELIAYYLN